MGYIGKKIRQRRLFLKNTDIGLIVPIDHGLTVGPIAGLRTIAEIGKWINNDKISAVILHKGVLEKLVVNNMLSSETGVILHLNGMTTLDKDADTKYMLTTIETALRLGADAVSVQINFNGINTSHNLSLLGAITDTANAVGLPLLTMLYDKVEVKSASESMDRMHRLIRIVTEMGTDMVKIAFPNSMHDIQDLVSSHCDDVQIFVAGGEKIKEETLREKISVAMKAGAHGLCLGRNVFQNENPRNFISRLSNEIYQTEMKSINLPVI